MSDIQAWLDQGKKLADQATEGPWFTSPFEHDPVWGSVVTGGVNEHEEDLSPCIEAGDREDATFIADARSRLPQALDALQAVLGLHQPTEFVGHSATWLRCTEGCYTWPCPTVQEIQNAIGDSQ